MKLKKNITKITALAGSAAMALSAVAVPVSANLGDLPAPYVQDGQFQGKLVVGDNAAPQDVLGAIDIAAGFQAESVTPVTVSGGGSVSVEGGEDYEQTVGSTFTADTLDDSDFDNFADADVSLDGEDHDFTETMSLGSNNLVTVSGLTSYSEEDNYGQDAYLELVENGVSYDITFDDPVESKGFEDDELDVSFLGQNLEVQDVSADQITVKTSNSYTLEPGDTVDVDDHTVELVRVGESSVLVDVDGQRQAVQYSPTKEEVRFDEADDFEVQVDSAFYQEGSDSNLAVLDLGGSITESYENNDALEIYGGSDDDDEASYIWQINTVSDTDDDSTEELKSFGVTTNQEYKEASAEDDDERSAIAVGEELELPNNYASLTFDGFTEGAMEDYKDVSLSFSNEDFSSGEIDGDASWLSSQDPVAATGDFLSIEMDEDDVFLEDGADAADSGSAQAEAVYFRAADETPGATDETIEVFYDDGEEEYYAGTMGTFGDDEVDVSIEIDDEKIPLTFANSAGNAEQSLDGSNPPQLQAASVQFKADFAANSDFSGTEELTWTVHHDGDGNFDYFGTESSGNTKEEAQGHDFAYAGGSKQSATLNAADDEARRTAYGVLWDDAESQFDSDEFEMSVPAQGHEARIIASSVDTTVSRDDGTSSSGAVEVNRAPVGLGVLSSEAESLLGDEPLVVVGGPFINSVASELLGNPTDAEIDQMFSPGMAKIRSFEDQQALLVAGYNAQDTVRASQVVANFNEYSDDLEGEEVELVFDGSDDVTFQEPSMDDSSDDSSSDDSSEDSDDSSEDSEQ